MSPIIFFIEGNIGSGKSTFIKNVQNYFANNKHAQFLQEPVDIWKSTKDNNGANILEHFYSDMNRFCYAFQSFAFISRIKQLDMIDDNAEYVFIERSVHNDRNVFANACHDSKMMTDIERNIYNTWFDWMQKKYANIFKSAYYIYLQCSPDTAYNRINIRARPEERNITLEYLSTLHEKHNNWLHSQDNTIILDAEQNFLDEKILIKTVKNIISKVNPQIFENKSDKSDKSIMTEPISIYSKPLHVKLPKSLPTKPSKLPQYSYPESSYSKKNN